MSAHRLSQSKSKRAKSGRAPHQPERAGRRVYEPGGPRPGQLYRETVESGYWPKVAVDRAQWQLARPLFLQVLKSYPDGSESARGRRLASMRASVAGYIYWLAGEDPDSLNPDRALDEVQIRRYLHSGLTGRLSHRSRVALGSPLRQFRAGFPNLFPPARPAPPAPELEPVSEKDFGLALRVCQTFRSPATRRHTTAYLLLGRGAGLGGADMRFVAGTDIRRGAAGALWVSVRRPGYERRVPVLRRFAAELERLARLAGDKSLLAAAPPPTKEGQPNEMTSALWRRYRAVHPGLVVSAQRLRKAWIAEHLSQLPLGVLLEAAGLTSYRAIESLMEFCPNPKGDAQRAALLGASPASEKTR